MIKFELYKKVSEFQGLYNYEGLLADFEKETGSFTLYGGFAVKKTKRGDLICRETHIDFGRLSSVRKDLFEVSREPGEHIFWFRTQEAAIRFLMSHLSNQYEESEPVLLEIPRISFFKDWYDKV